MTKEEWAIYFMIDNFFENRLKPIPLITERILKNPIQRKHRAGVKNANFRISLS